MLSRLTNWGKHALIGILLGFNKVAPMGGSRLEELIEKVEPEKQMDEWDQLMELYTNGTEEEQANAERILLAETPEDKAERDAIFLSRWNQQSTIGKVLPKRRGRSFASADLDDLREQSEHNLKERKAEIQTSGELKW